MARKGYAQTETANELESTWNGIVGNQWQTKTKVGTIRRGALEIIVSNSAVNQQLDFQKKKILNQLQTQLPKYNLKDLRFRVGNINWKSLIFRERIVVNQNDRELWQKK